MITPEVWDTCIDPCPMLLFLANYKPGESDPVFTSKIEENLKKVVTSVSCLLESDSELKLYVESSVNRLNVNELCIELTYLATALLYAKSSLKLKVAQTIREAMDNPFRCKP